MTLKRIKQLRQNDKFRKQWKCWFVDLFLIRKYLGGYLVLLVFFRILSCISIFSYSRKHKRVNILLMKNWDAKLS